MTAPDGVRRWDGPGLEAWKPWSPEEVTRALADFSGPWCVVGGWAIDLGLGRITRPHEDLEIAVVDADFPVLRARLEAMGLRLYEVGDGEVRALAQGQAPDPGWHQTWALDPAAGAWRVDVMRESGDAETWVYRRDTRISAPRAAMTGRTPAGAPYLRAQGALLFKAKGLRPKDEADFVHAAPRLDPAARGWLVDALTLVHPGHPWIARLAG